MTRAPLMMQAVSVLAQPLVPAARPPLLVVVASSCFSFMKPVVKYYLSFAVSYSVLV